MKTNKKNPRKKLENFSTVFMQLGLVLALFVAFISLEYQSEFKQASVIDFKPSEKQFIAFEEPFEYTREPNSKPIKPKTVTPTVLSNEIQKVDNNTTVKTTDVIITQPEKPKIDINKVAVVDEPIEINKDEEPKNFNLIQEAPVFRGCEGLSKKENKKCFNKMMRRFVQRNFDIDLAQELNLRSGKHRIITQFIINKKGEITNLYIRSPHKKLDKEVKTIVNKIPKFTPGKQNGKKVNVRYTLPISFNVE